MRYVVLILVPLMLLVSCKQPVPEQFTQENFSEVDDMPSVVQKCILSDIEYYHETYFIYHKNARGDDVFYTPIATYLKANQYPKWQVLLYIDKEDNLYTQTLSYMQEGKLPNDEAVVCEQTSGAPAVFDDFIAAHKSYFIRREKGGIEIE